MYQDDAAYYSNRADEENKRARQAASTIAAEIHIDLARRYGARAAQINAALPDSLMASEPNNPPSS
jgi:hypothetical protein